MLISLISFALTVFALRTFLWLTDYPQTGAGPVHVAHVLWGGLALFAATLLLLVISNRWVLPFASVLSGVGVGFFIDEVGKFVTTSNNYFTPVAAPIIYGVFMATVLVYLRVRRPPIRDPRGEMHRALEQIGGVLDGELGASELAALVQRLRLVQASAEEESTRELAASMLTYVEQERAEVVARRARRKPAWARVSNRLRAWVSRAGALRLLALTALVGCGVFQLLSVMMPLLPSSPVQVSETLVTRAFLEGGAGLVVLGGAALVCLRRDRQGIRLATAGLAFGLMVTDFLVIYQDQMKALLVTTLQCLALLTTLALRRACGAAAEADASDGEVSGEALVELSD